MRVKIWRPSALNQNRIAVKSTPKECAESTVGFATNHARIKKPGASQLSPTAIQHLQKKTVKNIVVYAQTQIPPHSRLIKYLIICPSLLWMNKALNKILLYISWTINLRLPKMKIYV